MPFYIVKEKNGKEPKKHLVKAKNSATALRAIVEQHFEIETASVDEAVSMTAEGFKAIEA